MSWMVILKTVMQFFKKNWKVILTIVFILFMTGILKRLFLKIGAIFSRSGSTGSGIDTSYYAMLIHSAMYKGLFNWAEDEEAIISLVNSLESQDQFMEVARKYAQRYGKDLREQLKTKMVDRKYAKLLFR